MPSWKALFAEIANFTSSNCVFSITYVLFKWRSWYNFFTFLYVQGTSPCTKLVMCSTYVKKIAKNSVYLCYDISPQFWKPCIKILSVISNMKVLQVPKCWIASIEFKLRANLIAAMATVCDSSVYFVGLI